nr:hypothetical protein [Tanacetum cinerariifolium]
KNKTSKEETKAVRRNTDASFIEEWVSDDEEENVTQPKIVKKPVKPGIVKKDDDENKVNEDPSKGNECNDQEKEDNVNVTNNVNTVSSTVNAVGTNKDNELPFNPNMPALKDVGTFDFSNEDEDDNIVADMNNMDTTFQVSPTTTTRIHKDHPLDQVIEDLHSATQTK